MKRIVLHIIIGLMTAMPMSAQNRFRTQELQRLATVLPLDAQAIDDGFQYPVVHGLPLVVHCQARVIDHIGLRLFSDQLRMQGNSPIFDFLERYFLQLKYPPMVKTASNMIRDDAFQFISGTLADIDKLRMTDDFSYSNDNHRYTATWSRNGQMLLSVSFPVEYELISGENKIEAENNLPSDVKRAVVKKGKDLPTRTESYINECFSNRLYQQNGQLIVSSRHPAESAANMMLSTNAKGKYDINITQISYGFQKKVFLVPLRQWIAFCKNNGCQLYFGIEQIADNGTVNAVVLAFNQAENYNHVLTVSIPADVISQRQGVVEARLYPYVPTHNVMNMFAKYRKSNPKTFVSR